MMKRFGLMAAAGVLFVGAASIFAPFSGKDHTATAAVAGTKCDGHEGKCGEKKDCCKNKMAKEAKAEISELSIVTKQELASLIEAKSVVVVDARDDAQFAAGHIDGAILLGTTELPADKSATLVFYCGSMKCPASTRAAKEALSAGYTNVKVYKGGWADWKANS